MSDDRSNRFKTRLEARNALKEFPTKSWKKSVIRLRFGDEKFYQCLTIRV